MSSATVHELTFEDSRRRPDHTPASPHSDCQMISLLTFLEEENRDLRRAVVDLALETLMLKSSVLKNSSRP